MSTAVAPSPALTDRFHALAREWRAATQFLASPATASEHPAYRAIVALGPAAVPLILAELAASPEPWFAALRELTGPIRCRRPIAVTPGPRPNTGWPGAAPDTALLSTWNQQDARY